MCVTGKIIVVSKGKARLVALKVGAGYRSMELSLTCRSGIDAPLCDRVFFRTDLFSYTNKSTQHPDYLNQLALEIVQEIPDIALQIYTDGSSADGAISGIGVFIRQGSGIRICMRNPDYCSVLRAELLAIEEVLTYCINAGVCSDIWILSDSRSSIQHLAEWWKHGDRVTANIVGLLNTFHHAVGFQWIPSHVDVYGNETADVLAKESSLKNYSGDGCLSFSEIASRVNYKINLILRLNSSLNLII